MPWSQYMRGIRGKIGDDLLVVPADGVAAFDDNGCLLLARHVHDSLWATPGGAIEPGEAPDEAAIRELREETASWPRVRSGVRGGVGASARHDPHRPGCLSLVDRDTSIIVTQTLVDRRF